MSTCYLVFETSLSTFCSVDSISLEVMTVQPKCENVLSSEGVPVYVTGVAQVKVSSQDEYLVRATEQFLGRKKEKIAYAVLQTLEGHLRAILGTEQRATSSHEYLICPLIVCEGTPPRI